jgi:hypothetical protein
MPHSQSGFSKDEKSMKKANPDMNVTNCILAMEYGSGLRTGPDQQRGP